MKLSGQKMGNKIIIDFKTRCEISIIHVKFTVQLLENVASMI